MDGNIGRGNVGISVVMMTVFYSILGEKIYLFENKYNYLTTLPPVYLLLTFVASFGVTFNLEVIYSSFELLLRWIYSP